MTENELRQKVADTIGEWLGAAQGSATHKEILAIYNGYKPLARGHKMQVSEHWCAATVSAAYIKAGIAEHTGTECSCSYFIEIARKKGIWVENDAHIPGLGDAVVYDWQDRANYAATDNVGTPDHIGIVTAVSRVAGTFTVTEGNLSQKVARRTMRINDRYIRGFICPDYAKIARELSGSASTPAASTAAKPVAAAPTASAKAIQAAEAARRFDKSLAGTYRATATLNIRNGAGTSKKILTTIPKGTEVRNYGYYNVVGGDKWLYIRFKQGGTTYTAFASAAYLAKQ